MKSDGAFGSWVRSGLVVVLIAVLAVQAVAQNSYAPDPLIEASLYAARAREQSGGCWRDAERWAEKSVKTARRFRSVSAIERDTAWAFIARQEMFLSDLRQRRKQGEQDEKLIEQALKAKRLGSAREFLDAAAGMSCEDDYQRMEVRWRLESSRAASLVADADARLNDDPKRARKT